MGPEGRGRGSRADDRRRGFPYAPPTPSRVRSQPTEPSATNQGPRAAGTCSPIRSPGVRSRFSGPGSPAALGGRPSRPLPSFPAAAAARSCASPAPPPPSLRLLRLPLSSAPLRGSWQWVEGPARPRALSPRYPPSLERAKALFPNKDTSKGSGRTYLSGDAVLPAAGGRKGAAVKPGPRRGSAAPRSPLSAVL